MKKIIKTLLVVMVIVLALTGCNWNEEPEAPETPACEHTGGAATCTEGAKCDLCGEVYTEALGHEIMVLPAIDATCSKEGRTAGEACKVCGAILVAQTSIEKLEHVWVDNVDRDFTCTLDGFKGGKHCDTCGIQDGTMEIIPAHHVWGEEYVHTEPTCGKAGIQAHDCTVCGEKEKVADIPATGNHSFTVDVEAKAPTCLDGYTAHKACDVCGAPNEEYEVIPGDDENGHHFAEENMFNYAEPTCTEDGMLAGYCSYCEGLFGLAYIPATGHKWEGGDCTTTGTCSVCGETSEGPIHTLVDVEGKDATCTEDGYTAYKACEKCDYTEGKEVVSATGHTLVDGICSTCGYISNLLAGKYFVPTEEAAAQVLSATWWNGGSYNVLTDGQKDQEAVGRFSTLLNNTTAFMDATMILDGAYDLGTIRFYIYDTKDTITEAAKKESIGKDILIQVYANGEWIDVVNCADNAALCEYLVINDGLNNDYLEFDLKGVAATRIRFFISGSLSLNGISFQEIECDAVVSKTLEPEKEKVLINNIFSGKAFTPTSDALASVLTAGWWKGGGYETLTDGIKNADNAPGRFSTVMATTGMMDATIDLGGTYELHSLKFYTYDPAAGTGATSLGTDLLIQVYANGEWKDVIVCADNATLASYLVVNEGTYNDYLEFDLGGIEAEKVRFYISASASGSGTTYEEIECNGYTK